MTREEARKWWDQPGPVKLSRAVLSIRWVPVPDLLRQPEPKAEGFAERTEREGLR